MKSMFRTAVATAAIALALAPAWAADAPPKTLAPKYGPWGVDYADMDKSVKPGDDFFAYAEGTWLRDHPIAPDKTGAGYNYDMPDDAELQLREIVEDAAKRHGDAVARQLGDI